MDTSKDIRERITEKMIEKGYWNYTDIIDGRSKKYLDIAVQVFKEYIETNKPSCIKPEPDLWIMAVSVYEANLIEGLEKENV